MQILISTLYDKLVIKFNALDTRNTSTSRLVTKTRYDSDKQGIEKGIEDVDKNISNTSGLFNLKTTYLVLLV